MSTGVRRSSYHRSPNDRDASNEAVSAAYNTRRPGEFQRAPWSIAPLPSKMVCRISAMRNARSGPLRRKAIDNAGHDLFRLPRTQLRQRGIQGRFAPNLRMRGRQKAPGLFAIPPNVFGRGNHARVLCRVPRLLDPRRDTVGVGGKPSRSLPGSDERRDSGSSVINLTYSGSGCPLVSGANGKAAKPTRNTRHMVTPA